MPMVRSVLRTAAQDHYRFGSLIEAIVMSDLFRMNVATGNDGKGATLQTQSLGPDSTTASGILGAGN
jgi:hypothetical protein